jgi:MscS family membrane protein
VDQIFFLPFQVLLWILGCTLVLDVLGRRFDFSFFENYISSFRSSGFILCLAWALLRLKTVVQSDVLNKDNQRRKVDAGFMQAIGKIASLVIMVITLMVVLQIWGLDIGPLIAFGGIGAAAIAFASKDVIANFCGGVMLHINHPFMVGDCIHVPNLHLEGYVEEIGWSLTRVRDKEKRPVYLPNAIFSSVMVINASRMTHRRIEDKVGIRYEDFSKIPVLVENLKDAISAHPGIDTHLPVLVILNGFHQFSLELYIDVYTLETRYDKYLMVKHEVMQLVYQELIKGGAEVSTPMMSISGRISSLQETVIS